MGENSRWERSKARECLTSPRKSRESNEAGMMGDTISEILGRHINDEPRSHCKDFSSECGMRGHHGMI